MKPRCTDAPKLMNPSEFITLKCRLLLISWLVGFLYCTRRPFVSVSDRHLELVHSGFLQSSSVNHQQPVKVSLTVFNEGKESEILISCV